MKKIAKTLLAGIALSSGLLFGTSDAFAMESKSDNGIVFHTDANTYGWGATSIDVEGDVPYRFSTPLQTHQKYQKEVRLIKQYLL
ncbi:hypothetical protein ACT4UT_03145, partial [Bacillus sp. B-TM1]